MKIKITALLMTIIFILSYAASASVYQDVEDDYYKLKEGINLSVEILAIRSLDVIDNNSDPDFFIRVFIDDQEFESPVYNDLLYIYDCCTFTKEISESTETVEVIIQLWDWNPYMDIICDISAEQNNENQGFFVVLTYNMHTGHWTGDDYIIDDPSGYGRLNGCDDGSIYESERDCEVWFDITQDDPDGDGIPSWTEVNVYGTDPEFNDTGIDYDDDGLPIEWEHRWGYDPFIYDDHFNLDSDFDSLNNYEEYLTRFFYSDPFRQDIFLEFDFMETGPSGEENIPPESSDEIVKNPFHRRNIVFHFDRGIMFGGDIFPFDEDVNMEELLEIYNEYFLNDEPDHWKRGVFHYGVFVHEENPAGYGFSGDVSPYWGYIPGTNGFIISCRTMEIRDAKRPTKELDYIYASIIMHEMGHNFGIKFGNPLGCDNRGTIYPWRLSYWLFGNYKSIMNYRYTYEIFDYSDGSHGWLDFNDWGEIDLTYFEYPENNSNN